MQDEAITVERANEIVAEECAELSGRAELPVVNDRGDLTDGTYREQANLASEAALRTQCREWVQSWNDPNV